MFKHISRVLSLSAAVLSLAAVHPAQAFETCLEVYTCSQACTVDAYGEESCEDICTAQEQCYGTGEGPAEDIESECSMQRSWEDFQKCAFGL